MQIECLFFSYDIQIRGAMGEISVILVKNQFFILLNKFNLHNIMMIL